LICKHIPIYTYSMMCIIIVFLYFINCQFIIFKLGRHIMSFTKQLFRSCQWFVNYLMMDILPGKRSGFELRQHIISAFFHWMSTWARTNLCLPHKCLSSIRKVTASTMHAFLHIQKAEICHFSCVCHVYTYSDLNSLVFVVAWT